MATYAITHIDDEGRHDYTTATKEQIQAAFEAGRCRIMYRPGDGYSLCKGVHLQGDDVDSEGGDSMMMSARWWSIKPKSIQAVYYACSLGN
jgi:hypothetical protein